MNLEVLAVGTLADVLHWVLIKAFMHAASKTGPILHGFPSFHDTKEEEAYGCIFIWGAHCFTNAVTWSFISE